MVDILISPIGRNEIISRQGKNDLRSIITGGGSASLSYTPGYIRTYEPVDANTLVADDFSRGSWYAKNFDDATGSGSLYDLPQMGWGGTIYNNPITPAGAIVGGFVGLHGREFAATSGQYSTPSPDSQGNMADHGFLSLQSVDECYFRVYFQPQANYVGGHEKMFDFMWQGVGSAVLAALGNNLFGSDQFNFIPYNFQDGGRGSIGPTDPSWMPANLAPDVTFVKTHWHYLEMRIVLNTPGSFDGIYEFWMDDCGVDGTSGPSTPTKRGSYTDVKFRSSSSEHLNGIWIETWGNAGSTGEMRYANVIVSKAFTGFADPTHQP